jgi:hypothetical protein
LGNFLLHYDVAAAATNFFKTPKSAFLKIAQTSLPDRTRNLTNRYLHLGDKKLVMEALFDFFRRSGLEKKVQELHANYRERIR